MVKGFKNFLASAAERDNAEAAAIKKALHGWYVLHNFITNDVTLHRADGKDVEFGDWDHHSGVITIFDPDCYTIAKALKDDEGASIAFNKPVHIRSGHKTEILKYTPYFVSIINFDDSDVDKMRIHL